MIRQLRKLVFLTVLVLPLVLSAEVRNRYMDYIDRYSMMAVHQMLKYKVPASITMAQALLESAAGNSPLARDGNNHFGIKCGSSWTGPYMLMTDDAPNEHFRVYSSVEESYEDHSLFLRQNRRYSGLFNLKETDYAGWARGLKAAGYATAPHYAESLIQLIENYDLARLDKTVYKNSEKIKKFETGENYRHQVYMCNGIFYTIAQDGDSFKQIGKEMGVSERKLRKYNEVDKRYVLHTGDIVYFEKKPSKADKAWKGKWHVVEVGESMYTISQRFGVQMKTLYKINFKDGDYVPKVGDLILLR